MLLVYDVSVSTIGGVACVIARSVYRFGLLHIPFRPYRETKKLDAWSVKQSA